MAATWRLLTDYLRNAGEVVELTWRELDEIVGGLPASAVKHHPQWWSGDRSHTRAWREAGYKPKDIRPGISVRFVKTVELPRSTPPPARQKLPRPEPQLESTESIGLLRGLDPSECLIVIPCSATKRSGGRRQPVTPAPTIISEARERVLRRPDSHTDESRTMPAWQRYNGQLYRAAASVLPDLVNADRLVILSGGYGVLRGSDLIGNYNRIMKSRDWPRSTLESVLATLAKESGYHIVAFAGGTTDYAKVVRRTRWELAPGRTAHLVTLKGIRGANNVSKALGVTLRSFVNQEGTYPQEISVERRSA